MIHVLIFYLTQPVILANLLCTCRSRNSCRNAIWQSYGLCARKAKKCKFLCYLIIRANQEVIDYSLQRNAASFDRLINNIQNSGSFMPYITVIYLNLRMFVSNGLKGALSSEQSLEQPLIHIHKHISAAKVAIWWVIFLFNFDGYLLYIYLTNVKFNKMK